MRKILLILALVFLAVNGCAAGGTSSRSSYGSGSGGHRH